MKKKRMLTLEDLFKFCKSQKLYSFSSKEKGYQLCVAVPAHFEKEDESSSNIGTLSSSIVVGTWGANGWQSGGGLDFDIG